MKYYYFPIDKIEKDSKIAVYGYGVWGKRLVEWNRLYHWCDIKFIIDKSFGVFSGRGRYKVEDVTDWDLDYILLSSKIYEDEFIESLNKYDFPKDKIVCLDEGVDVDEAVIVDKTATELGKNNHWGEDGINWYSRAERGANDTFSLVLEPVLCEYDLMKKYANKKWLDFGCGEGRIVNLLKEKVNKIYCCDINSEAIHKCKKRFAHDENIVSFVNEERHIPIENEFIDLIFSVGTMVSFNLREVQGILKEMYRVLKSNGYCIIHHSNWRRTDGYFKENSTYGGYYRGDVAAEDVVALAHEFGFEVIEQKLIPWGKLTENIDCITVLFKE